MYHKIITENTINFILDQGEPSLNEQGNRACKGVGDLRSPVGFLVGDDLYDPRIERVVASHQIVIDLVQEALELPRFSDRQEGVLHELEDSHNRAIGADNFRQEFIDNVLFYADADEFDINPVARDVIIRWSQKHRSLGLSASCL